VHIDIIDGTFVHDFTMGSSIINCIRKNTSLPFDYHLMVTEPGRLSGVFPVGPDDYYTIHQEATRNLHRELVRIKQNGSRSGVAVSPGTSLESLEYVIEDVELVLLMMVNPGYMGQPLVPQTLRKIKNLKKMINEMRLEIHIAVDGNVNKENIPAMVAAGADMLVLGSSGLFHQNRSIVECMEDIYEAIEQGRKIKA
jgi:ribulose-phosphate 3-epimerase